MGKGVTENGKSKLKMAANLYHPMHFPGPVQPRQTNHQVSEKVPAQPMTLVAAPGAAGRELQQSANDKLPHRGRGTRMSSWRRRKPGEAGPSAAPITTTGRLAAMASH